MQDEVEAAVGGGISNRLFVVGRRRKKQQGVEVLNKRLKRRGKHTRRESKEERDPHASIHGAKTWIQGESREMQENEKGGKEYWKKTRRDEEQRRYR